MYQRLLNVKTDVWFEKRKLTTANVTLTDSYKNNHNTTHYYYYVLTMMRVQQNCTILFSVFS